MGETLTRAGLDHLDALLRPERPQHATITGDAGATAISEIITAAPALIAMARAYLDQCERGSVSLALDRLGEVAAERDTARALADMLRHERDQVQANLTATREERDTARAAIEEHKRHLAEVERSWHINAEILLDERDAARRELGELRGLVREHVAALDAFQNVPSMPIAQFVGALKRTEAAYDALAAALKGADHE